MSNELYTVLAWLPGTENFAVQADSGEIGYVEASTDTAEFRPMFPQFVDAAVHKYGYKRINPVKVSLAGMAHVAKQLNAQMGV
jgi:hypothetical protein